MKPDRRTAFAVMLGVGGGLALLWGLQFYPPWSPPHIASLADSSIAAAWASAAAPLPAPPDQPAEKLELGERLFKEPRLSHDDSLACSGCHVLERGGMDSRPVSIGVGGAAGAINAPTVFNSSFNFVQFWDGRAATLEEQAAGPVHNPIEMASNWTQVLAKLRSDPSYVEAFASVYPDGISATNIVDALATFERSLVTPDSRFDRYLKGDSSALDAREVEGYQLFRSLGCTSCHQGVLLGGNMFQKFGAMRDYFADRVPTKADLGRYNVTGREEDRHVFKVPSLRNVALTAPYFHDASANTLEQAVIIMARHQLGRDLPKKDVDAIAAFLHSLTGTWLGQPLG